MLDLSPSILLLILSSVFVIFVLLPFLPNLKEWKTKTPVSPSSHPREKGKLMRKELKERKKKSMHDFFHEWLIQKEPLILKEDSKLLKPAYTSSTAYISEHCHLSILVCDKKSVLEDYVKVKSWVDSSGQCTVGKHCDLGETFSCGSLLTLEEGCTFKQLFGLPIQTLIPAYRPKDVEKMSRSSCLKDNNWVIDKKRVSLSSGISPTADLSCKQTLHLKTGAVIKNNLRSSKHLIIDSHVTIYGDVFSEKGIIISPYCTLLGTVYTNGKLRVGRGVKMGKKGKSTTVVGIKGIHLDADVEIYGTVYTKKLGKIEKLDPRFSKF